VRLAARIEMNASSGTTAGPQAAGRAWAYLQRKRQRDQDLEQAGSAASELVSQVHQQLCEVATLAVELPASPRAADDAGEPARTLYAAYLVADGDEARFDELVAALTERYPSRGLTARLTGPWPPYNFVHLDLKAEAA
jgi:hypothetical protein